jgi:hypothetical protein
MMHIHLVSYISDVHSIVDANSFQVTIQIDTEPPKIEVQ